MNFDQLLLDYRNDRYDRRRVFIDTFLKHFHQNCFCKKNNKVCDFHFECIRIKDIGNEEYLQEMYEAGILETFYNVMVSITNSLRCRAGIEFEGAVEQILQDAGIPFQKQIGISMDGYFRKRTKETLHYVDLVIPHASLDTPLHEFKGELVSIKTTVRERWMQDKFLNVPITLISLEKCPTDEQMNSIHVHADDQGFTKWIYKLKKKYGRFRVLDLFCGAGGFSKGFMDAGFEVMLGIDFYKEATETYSTNLCHPSLCIDLTQFSPLQCDERFDLKKKGLDVIIGGPPCQGFSMAGRRDGKDPRNQLFMEFVKYLDYFQPKVFVMENVIGLLSMKINGESAKDVILKELSKHYHCTMNKLLSSDFEVPQNRRRLFIIGVHKSYCDREPDPILPFTDDKIPVRSILEKQVSESYYLSQKAIEGIHRKRNRMKEEKKGFGAQFLNLDKPCYTIPARYWKDGYDALVYDSETRIRRLTELELKRIQSFPDDYKFCGSRKNQIIQIGNAVPVRLAYHIALFVKQILSSL